jgi:L-ascorbate metabolism protein UlaG (beta-lactamase superfamily)
MANGSLTWLGHASFRLDTPGGKRVYVDPWLSGPTCPESEKEPERIDVLALTHGHSDHAGDAAVLGKRFSPPLVAMNELAYVLEEQHGYPNASSGGMNRGGTVEVEGVRFTMTNAFHSSSLDGVYTGEAAGLVIEVESGFKLYFAGDTNVFGDMQLIGRIYQPDIPVLPIGDHYTMGPKEAAVALELLGVKRCVPCHWGTFPLFHGTPAQLRELVPGDVEIVDVEPGGTLEL